MALTAKIHALGTKNKQGEDCKGNVSIYGMTGKFPLTLYPNQWEELAKVIPAILEICRKGVKEGKLSPNPTAKASGDRIAL